MVTTTIPMATMVMMMVAMVASFPFALHAIAATNTTSDVCAHDVTLMMTRAAIYAWVNEDFATYTAVFAHDARRTVNGAPDALTHGRAFTVDREAVFPFENWADLREAGFLGLCVPAEHGGMGADFVGYALVAEELARHCAATALTFNMHVATTLLAGQIADDLTLEPAARTELETNRTALFRGIVEGNAIHSQPFSEGVAVGATAGIGTRALPQRQALST